MLCVWHDLFDGLCFLPVLYQVSYDGLATHNKGALLLYSDLNRKFDP